MTDSYPRRCADDCWFGCSMFMESEEKGHGLHKKWPMSVKNEVLPNHGRNDQTMLQQATESTKLSGIRVMFSFVPTFHFHIWNTVTVHKNGLTIAKETGARQAVSNISTEERPN